MVSQGLAPSFLFSGPPPVLLLFSVFPYSKCLLWGQTCRLNPEPGSASIDTHIT